MAREWVSEKRFHMEPLPRPGTFSFFNGTHDSITHLVRGAFVQIGTHRRPWTFLVVSATPMPVVLGLDAIRGWPLFYSPLDDRLFVLPEQSSIAKARQQSSDPPACKHCRTGRRNDPTIARSLTRPIAAPLTGPPPRINQTSPLSGPPPHCSQDPPAQRETSYPSPPDLGTEDWAIPLTLDPEPTPGDVEISSRERH